MRGRVMAGAMRQFDTGATRDREDGKIDYEGFINPLVLQAFGEYMHQHRKQSDGQLRASDNWQKGIPKDVYIKSLWRHFMDLWLTHRNLGSHAREPLEDALCGIMFNVMGYYYEILKNETSNNYLNKE
ncbi:MAG: hypothetical protein QME51_10470 [Planctomycetota bacterium]|nr:hypothetical protein [Planctomycetota bacterium]